MTDFPVPRGHDVAIGVDLGATTIKGGIVDRTGQCHVLPAIPTEAQAGAATVLENIQQVISAGKSLIEDHDALLIGVGVGTPGGVRQPDGQVIGGADNFSGWNGTRVGSLLSESLGGLPVVVDNDANAATLGEWLFARTPEERPNDFVGLTLGTGVGGGWISRGELIRGRNGLGGEFGHMCIVAGGRQCNCGGRGCLEMYTSIRGVQTIASNIKERGIGGGWIQTSGPEIVAAATSAAKAGDAQARELWRQYGCLLGAGISAIIIAVQPDEVVLLGGISHAAEYFLPAVREVLAERDPYCADVRVTGGNIRGSAGVLGAAALVWAEQTGGKTIPAA